MQSFGTKITFEVHSRKIGMSQTEGVAGGTYDLKSERVARMVADDYNVEEKELARGELRNIRTEFVVVKATTAYEVV